jgi:hypothetical protein
VPGSDDTLRVITQVDLAGIQTGMAESAAAVEAGTQAMAASFQEMAEVSEYSVTEARHAIHGLGEEIGVHMPRFVQSFLADLGGVGPVMAAAFAPIAVIGLVEVLGEIPKKLEEGISYLHGWNEEAKKDFKEAVEAAAEFEHHQIKLNEEIAKIALIGVKGPEKYAAELKIVGSTTEELVDLQNELEKKLVAVSAEKEYLQNATSWKQMLEGTSAASNAIGLKLQGAGEMIEKDKIQTEAWVQTLKQVTEEIEHRQKLEMPTLSAEGVVAAREQAEQKARADEEAAKRAQAAWHQQVIAELNDAERAAKEKTQLLAEEAKETREFYKNIEEEEKKLDKEIERTQEEALHRAIEINNKEVHEEEEKVKKIVEFYMHGFDRITKNLNSNVVSMINGQESFKRAAQKMWTSVADNAIENILKIGEKQVEQKLISIVMTNEQKAVETTAAAEGAAATQAAMFKEQFAAAKAGAAKAYQAMAGIPIIGPELGAIAGAATFAAIMAFEKGGIMPSTDVALLHPNEMVLPAHISESVQRAADNGTMGSGGGHTFNYINHGSGGNDQARTSSRDFFRQAKRELRRLNR